MVLGHAAVTAAGRRILGTYWAPLLRLPLAWLLLGAYLPDLVDKPLSHLAGLPGRGYAHSLMVQVPLLGALCLLTARWRAQAVALWLGASLHLLEDWVDPVTLLAPLLGPIPEAPPWNAFGSFFGFYQRGGPLVWIEVTALAYWLGVAWSQRQRLRPGNRGLAAAVPP